MAKSRLIPLLVTTEFKGVFFGYAPPGEEGPERLRLENARLVVYWSSDVRGVFGLAANGPTNGCRIGPRVPAITLFNITSGDGSNKYWNAALAIIVGDRGQKLYEDGCAIALWKSDKHGNPSNGGNGGPRSIGLIEEIEGPLRLCTENALHATHNDEKWKGERIWIVALYPPFEVADDKLGSLKREILAEIIGDMVITE